MRKDIEDRLVGEAGRARDLLRPLAFAQGAGLPWEEGIWAHLASSLAERAYGDEDIEWLIRQAGYYIIESIEEQRSVYRLYHEALAEHLREDCDPVDVHRRITLALTPAPSPEPKRWKGIHPYVRGHLATHAARGECIDDFLLDPAFLLVADRGRLLTVMAYARGAPARAAASAFQQAVPWLAITPEEEHAGYLLFAAHQHGAARLAAAIVASGATIRWRTRWAQWNPAQPHRLIANAEQVVDHVALARAEGREVILAFWGQDPRARMWDLATGRYLGASTHPGQAWTRWFARLLSSLWAAGLAGSGSYPSVASRDGEAVLVTNVLGRLVLNGLAGDRPARPHGRIRRVVAICADAVGGPVVLTADKVNPEPRRIFRSRRQDVPINRVLDPFTGREAAPPWTEPVDRDSVVRGFAIGGVAVAVCLIEDRLAVYELATGRRLREATIRRGARDLLAVGEVDGVPVALTLNGSREIAMWDLRDLSPLRDPLEGHTAPITSLTFSELDGRAVAVSGSADRSIRVWDLQAGTPVGEPRFGHQGGVTSATVTETDGRRVIVSAGSDATLRVWDLHSPLAFPIQQAYLSVVAAVAALPGGDRLAVAYEDSERVWIVSGKDGDRLSPYVERQSLQWHLVCAVGEVASKPVLFTAGTDRQVRVWSRESLHPVGRPWAGHTGSVTAMAIGEIDGRPTVVTGGKDGEIVFWDPDSGSETGRAERASVAPIRCLHLTTLDGKDVLISGGPRGRVQLWKPADRSLIGTVQTDHADAVSAVASAVRDGRDVLVTGSVNGSLFVWDPVSGRRVHALTGHTGGITAVLTVDINGSTVIASASQDRTVRLWDLASGRCLRVLEGHTAAICAMALLPTDGRPLLATVSADHTARIWDLERRTPAGPPLRGHSDVITAVAAARRGNAVELFTVGVDGAVKRWNLTLPLHAWYAGITVGRPLNLRPKTAYCGADGSPDPTSFLAVEDDDRVQVLAPVSVGPDDLVIAGCASGAIAVWDSRTGTPIRRLPDAHEAPVTALAAGRIGGRPAVVSGSTGGSVHVWHLTGPEHSAYPKMDHGAEVTAAAVLPLGNRSSVLVTGGVDGRARFWRPETGAPGPVLVLNGPILAIAADEAGHRVYIVASSERAVVEVASSGRGLRARAVSRVRSDGSSVSAFYARPADTLWLARETSVTVGDFAGAVRQVFDVGSNILRIADGADSCSAIVVTASGIVHLQAPGVRGGADVS